VVLLLPMLPPCLLARPLLLPLPSLRHEADALRCGGLLARCLHHRGPTKLAAAMEAGMERQAGMPTWWCQQ